MDDALPVRGVERLRDFDPVPHRLFGRQATAREAIHERLAFEVLHDEVFDVVVFSDVEEGADMRVGELGDRLGFPLEAPADLVGGRETVAENLDGDDASEPRVPGLVHLSHPAGADRAEDLERAEARSGCQRQVTQAYNRSGSA